MKKAHQVSAIILAAGQSQRMGTDNKLLIKFDNCPMIEHVAITLGEANLSEIIVVTGFEAEHIESALKSYEVEFVHNPDYEKGLSTSLITGLRSIDHLSEAFIVCLGDMPMVKSSDINELINAFNPDVGHEVCVPMHLGKRGNPVLWSRRFIKEMMQLEGDVGAKRLLHKYNDVVCEVPMQDSGVLLDFDTQETIRAFDDGNE